MKQKSPESGFHQRPEVLSRRVCQCLVSMTCLSRGSSQGPPRVYPGNTGAKKVGDFPCAERSHGQKTMCACSNPGYAHRNAKAAQAGVVTCKRTEWVSQRRWQAIPKPQRKKSSSPASMTPTLPNSTPLGPVLASVTCVPVSLQSM